LQALRAATVTPAEALGLEREIGSLETGKLADLVIIDGDILADIRVSDRVSMVMLNGRLYDAKTLNETVTGDRRSKPFFWQSD
jgi:imidazolonepropionase-like amidohydrolase